MERLELKGTHWLAFAEKIGKPTVTDDKPVFSSGCREAH